MPRRRRRSSRSPSADVPRSISPGKGAKEDCDIEPAPLLQVPRPWPLKHVLIEAFVIAFTAGFAAGGPWNAAHEQLRAMLGKSSLDTPLSDHSVVDDSTEDPVQSTGSAVQAEMHKERTLASSPDFFFTKGAVDVDAQSGDDTRSSGKSLARASVMGTGLPLTHRSGEIPDKVIEPTCATGAMTWMHAHGQTPVAEEPTDPAGPTSHHPGEIPEREIEPTCVARTMTWVHASGQTPVAEEPTDPTGSKSATSDKRELSLPAGMPPTMSAGQATAEAGILTQSAAVIVETSSFLQKTLGVEEAAPTAGGADKEVRVGESTDSVLFFSLATTTETNICPVEMFDPHLPMCSSAHCDAVAATIVPLDVDSAPPGVLPENPSFPARDVVAVEETLVAAVSATTAPLNLPDELPADLVLAATPVSLTEQVAATTTIDNPLRSLTPEDFSCPVLRESPLERKEAITPASLSSATELEHVSQRATDENTGTIAGIETLPSRPTLESTDCRLRTPAEVERWIGMLRCTANFPDNISPRTSAETMTAPSYPAEDVQNAAVTAEDELPLKTLHFRTVANLRRSIANLRRLFPKFHSPEDSAPSLPISGHETTSVATVSDTKPTEAELAEEPARCPRVVLEAPFSFATDFPERTPTEVQEGAQSTCPLSVQEDERTTAGRGQEKAMCSDEVTFKTLPSSTASTLESITAGGETCGVLTQLLFPRDEVTVPPHALPTCPATLLRVIFPERCTETGHPCSFPADYGPTALERRVPPRELSTCPATLLGVICAERDTETVYPCSCPAEDGPTAAVGSAVEPTHDADALLYRPGSTAGISTTRVNAEARSTSPGLAEGGRADANMSADDEKVQTLSCPASVPLAMFSGEQTDMCPFLFKDTPEATGMLADGVSLFSTMPSWATGLPATCTAEDVVGEVSVPYLPIKGVTTTTQARGDAETQGETNSCAATVPDIFFSPAEVEEIPRYHPLAESAATAAGALRHQTDPAAVEPSSSSHGTDQEMLMDSTQYLGDSVEASSTAAGDKERGGGQEDDEFQESATDGQDEFDTLEAVTEAAKLKCELYKKGLEDGRLRLEMLVREFNSWIRSINFPVRKVEAAAVAGGMRAGLVATEALAGGEPYLRVPESITLDASKAREDPELGPPLAKIRTYLSPIGLWDDELDSLRVLLIAEMFARADRSLWAPYLRLLPTLSDMMSYHPLFFGYSTIASLGGSDVQAALRKRRFSEVEAFNSKFVDDVSAVRELEEVLGEGWITLDRYLWATAILDSRMIWWDGRKHLVPLLDLVNNAQGPPGTVVQETLQDAEGNAVAATTQSFETGKQVLENYGHANHVLFLYHGFSLGRENRHDCVWIAPKRLPRGPGHGLMLARMQEAFPGGRPSFCISLDNHGPYDFVSYVRIAAGLPAFPSPPPVEGEPLGIDESSCQCAAEEISEKGSEEFSEECSEEGSMDKPVERSVHERWEDLRYDPEGLRAVVVYLETRLSKYPRSGSDGGGGRCSGGNGGSCGGSGGRSVGVATENGGGACGGTTVEEETRKFLDSEQHLLQEIVDYLVTFVPPSSPPKKGPQNDKAVAGNYSRDDISGDANKRSGYDDGNSQAEPVS